MLTIRKKLLISNMAMILIPAVAILVTALILMGLTFGHGDRFGSREYFHRIGNEATDLYLRFSQAVEKNPDAFLNPTYLKELSGEAARYGGFVVVIRGDAVLYSSLTVSEAALPELLKHSENQEAGFQRQVILEDRPYGLLSKPVAFTQGEPGMVYVLADMSPFTTMVRTYLIRLGVASLLILIITNGLLTGYLSRGILRPIRELQAGTRRIREGNLDFRVVREQADEIGSLCEEFDLMREKLKDSLEAQVQYEEGRKELIGSISHDLRTPMTAVRGYVEGVLDGIADTPDKQKEYLESALRRLGDLDRLVTDLALYSRLEAGQMPCHPEPLDMEACIREVLRDYERSAADRGIVVTTSSYGAPVALADRHMLRRIVTNLMDNAMAAVPDGAGSIEVVTERQGETVRLKVLDNGTGIPEDHISKVFGRFHRVDSARSQHQGGSGLGLTIVLKLTEQMGGRAELTSVLHQGTTVTITLPVWRYKDEADPVDRG